MTSRYIPAIADRQHRANVPVLLDTASGKIAPFRDAVARDRWLSDGEYGSTSDPQEYLIFVMPEVHMASEIGPVSYTNVRPE